METALAFIIGLLYAVGLYLIMRRSLFKLIVGLSLMGHAANLLIFTVGRLTRDKPAVVADGLKSITESTSDPLPQALILTAIVIGFGAQAFAIVLLHRSHKSIHTDDFDEISREISTHE